MTGRGVPLREHVEALLAEHGRRYDERVAAVHAALKLQAEEYERRLDDLNHAHERAETERRTYLTQQRYEDAQKAEKAAASALALELVDARLKVAENWRSKMVGVGAVLVLFAGLVGALVMRAVGG